MPSPKPAETPRLRGGDLPAVRQRVQTPDGQTGVIAWTQAPSDRYPTWTSVVQVEGRPGKRYRTSELRPGG